MPMTLMQGHSGLAVEQIQCWIISTNKQAMSIKLAAMVGHDRFLQLFLFHATYSQPPENTLSGGRFSTVVAGEIVLVVLLCSMQF